MLSLYLTPDLHKLMRIEITIMEIEVAKQIGAVAREVASRDYEGKPARVVVASQTYSTTAEDLFEAITTAERIPRWFMPITGDLRLGGRYQLQGNAGGEILICEPPTHLRVTWEFGGETSWLEVWIEAVSPKSARLTLEHVAYVSDERWNQFGPGAVGAGWDLALVGLTLHIETGAPKITEHTEISDDDKALWRKQGHFLDEQGRRINPYAEQVTTTPGFGMFAGRGRYWEMGPNRFDNAGISVWFQGEKEPRYLMNCVVRNPKQPEGVWGVPGGFYDKNADQSTRDTALRELEEETSIEQQMMEELIDAGMLHEFAREEWPQVDRSATLHAWQEGGYHFYVPKGPQVTRLLGGLALQPKDESEKIRAIAFVPFSKIGSEEVPTMGSHLRAIQLHRRLWPEILQSM